ncbi:A-kinase anchor protein 9 isoform X2 [Mobula hypostoma]|uniref:A-kinase anchor protein 9 isoform X2 n=1 Tax=Mobula hypostoma TaxID=723540 RepID=UPI002FC2EB45
MEDEERQKKLEAGKAKLAQFRQRKAQTDTQNPVKKQKKKKVASRGEEQLPRVTSKQNLQGGDARSVRGPAGDGTDFIIKRTLHSGDVIRQDQMYTIEAESEVSTTADDCTSEGNGCTVQQEILFKAEDMTREEEFSISDICSEHDTQPFQTRLELMDDDLATKHEAEELNREPEELNDAGGLQQLQDFEAAIKQRDGIITQLTDKLQQARKEKDEILQEFLDLTEQSQKLQIQFQQLQASEAVRSTSHGTTAADLIQSKQQLVAYQMQIDDQEQQLKTFQKINQECQDQIKYLQAQLQDQLMNANEKTDKDQLIEHLEQTIKGHESAISLLKDKMLASEKIVQDLNDHILQKNQEAENLKIELMSSKQRERQSSEEIKHLMGNVEALQKRCHMGNLSELETVQRIEVENQRKMDQLQAELDEMYGKQIVQMKQELQQQHASEIRKLTEHHKSEMEKALGHSVNNLVNEEQINVLNMAINELNAKLRDSHFQRDQVRQDMSQQLEKASEKQMELQNQVQDLLEELNFTKDQMRKASENITDQKYKMQEVEELKDMVDQLKAQLNAALESNKDLESKHEAEVTNYKIKLDMLEREKDEVLDRMAESQEAELERLRTQLLFSHEEELSKLKEDLERDHKLKICTLQEQMALNQNQQLASLQKEFGKKIEEVNCEKDNMVIKNNQLLCEVNLLKEEIELSQKSSMEAEMRLQISELEMEVKALTKNEKEKSILEKEIVELQTKRNFLEEQIKEQESMKVEITVLQEENEALKKIKKEMEEKLKTQIVPEVSKLTSFSERDLAEMRGQIERLTVVNEHLEAHERELKEEVERQRNTFSFAEKNFEVNFQELRDEYDCLLKMKFDIEEKMLKQEVEYETKLKALSEQLQVSESREDADDFTVIKQIQLDKTLDDSSSQPEILGSREVIEKDATELMEKLEIAQQDKKELAERLSDLSEVLILRQNEILHLKEELKSLKEQAIERCEKTDIIENQKLMIQEGKLSQMNLIKTKNERQSKQPDFTVTSKLKENEQENLTEQIISLQNSMKIIVSERDELRQNQINLIQEKESLLTEIKTLREKHISELSDSLHTERDSCWHHLESGQSEQLGFAELTPQKSFLEEIFHKNGEETKNTLIIAQQEKTVWGKVEDQSGGSACELNSEPNENQAELKLQLEAQRISLTQIHAAQLELVRDNLKNESEVALERLQEKLAAAHALEINELRAQFQQELLNIQASQKGTEESSQMLMERLNMMISDECLQLSQAFVSALGEDYLIEKRKPQEQSEEVVTPGNTDYMEKENQVHKDPVEEAKEMQINLERLQKYLLQEYNQLVALQTQLASELKKIEDRQAAYLNLQSQTEEENIRLRMQIESTHASSQDLNDLKEQLRIRSARLEEIVKLKQAFCQQKAELEDQHSEEIKNMKTSYEKQYQEMEAKYVGEIICLQQKLQKITGFGPQSGTGINETIDNVTGSSVVEIEQRRAEEHKVELNVNSIQEQPRHMDHQELLQQEQNLTKTLHGLEVKYHQKPERIQSMVTCYGPDRKGGGDESDKFAGGEPISSVQSLNEILTEVSLQGTEENKEVAYSVRRLEKQYEEQMQEEIAKVIVQMSVRFAQQTEMARVRKDVEEEPNTSKVSDEEWKKEVECTLKQDLQFQFDAERKQMEELFSKEKEELQETLKQKNAEILSIQRQMQDFRIKYKLGTCDVISETALQEEFLKAEQEMLRDSYAAGNSSLKEISLEYKMEDSEFENQEVAQERLEDMRQELVRQDQEHQQSLEALRQLHTQQLERLQEEQEELLAEVEKLKGQLQETTPIYNVKVVSQNERMLAELECFPAAGEERLPLEYCNSSTQTEMSEREDQHKSPKHSEQCKNIPSSFEEKSEETNQSVLISQRNSLQKANDRLLKVLSEVVKTTAAAEETINRHISAIVERSVKGQLPSRMSLWEQDAQDSIDQLKPFTLHSQGKDPYCDTGSSSSATVNMLLRRILALPCPVTEDEQPDSYAGTDTEGDVTTLWTGGTDEGPEQDHNFTQDVFSGGELDSETEELVLHVGTRLQATLEKLLEAITETTYQLDHARITETELVRESVSQKELIADLHKHQEELLERLNEELKAREQLALELHKAESIIDGYTDEKASLERQIQEKAESQHQITQELQHTSSRLQELEEERQQLQHERELISRQRVAMKENAGSVELQFLEETEKLMKEKRDVQRQAEKEQNDLTKQVKMLESELEEQVNMTVEMEQEKNAEILDLQQQILALEKQLEKNRKFLDEQAIDREQERDVFQQEILKLEQQLKTPQRLQSNNDQRSREMDHLTDQLKDKTDRCSELLLAKEQLQRDVQERNEEIDKLENRVRELEQALISTTYPLQKIEERKPLVTLEVKGDSTLQTQLQAERDALERKEKEIGNLEEQLEQFREELLNKNEEVQQLHMQLEIQRKESTTQLQEIQQENKQLKNKVENLLASLKDSSESFENRQSPVENLSRNVKEKDEEIVKLNEQIITMQQQLEIFSDNKLTEKKDEQIRDLEAQIEYLKSDQERLKKHNEEEVEQLNEVIEKLQQELTKVMPLGLVSSEEEENLKHQLDVMNVEKELLQQEIDKQREEVIFTKQKLEEQSKMLQTQGLELANSTVEKRGNFPEGSQDTINSVTVQMQELQIAIKEKEKELDSCNLQIQNLKQQAQAETEVHEKQILALEEALREKVATVLVSQVQLKAVQQQVGLCLEQQLNQINGKGHIPNIKEDTVLVQQLQEGEQMQDVKTSPSVEQPTQLDATSITDLVVELNQVKAEAAITKEELNSCREETEKLLEDLQAKEQVIINLQEKLSTVTKALCKAEEKAAHFEQDKQTPEECRNFDEVDKPRNDLIQERPIKIQANSTLQTEIPIADVIELENAEEQIKPSLIPSEEITNIKKQYSEKIDQLKELHAVEMNKLEEGHSAEMEALKKDYTTQINELTEKYDALKTMVHIGRPEPLATLQLRDKEVSGQEYTTISEATRRQSNITPALQSTFEQGTENLPDKIKSLLHEVHQEGMQVLSLSESPHLEGQLRPLENNPNYWLQERQGLLDVVQSLNDVLSKIQGTGEAKALTAENITDWRRELLQAVQHVFNKEHDAFITAVHAQASSLNNVDAMTLLSLLKEQETQRRADVQLLMTADRNSMMMEIRELWSYLQRVQQGDRKPNDVREHSTQRMELLENNLKQKQAQILTLQMELNTLKAKGPEFQDHLNSEKMLLAELKNELSQTKLELETTLKAQHKHFKELEMLRVELTDKAAAVETLNAAVANEQKRSQDLEWAIEKEKRKLCRREEHDREELEDLKLALEDHKRKLLQLECALVKDRETISELRQSMDSEKAQHKAELSRERSRITELQVILDAEKSRASDLTSALEQERQLSKQFQGAEEMQEARWKPPGKSSEMLIRDLQKQLSDQRNRTVELVSEMERYKLESLQLKQRLEEQQQIHRKSLLKEQESHRLVLEKVDSLQLQAKELLQQLEKEKREVLKLQREEGKLKETLLALQGSDQIGSQKETERHLETSVTEKIHRTEETCKIEPSSDRTKNWIIQQKLATTDSRNNASVSDRLWYAHSVSGAETDRGSCGSGENINLETIRQKIQLIISKLSIMVNKATNRIQDGAETTDENDLIWLHNSIQDLALQLQQLQVPVENIIHSTGSTSSLIEQLLRQNADLTGYVSRLSEEKNDLHNNLLKLEEEVRKHRHLSSSGEQLTRRSLDNQDCVDILMKSERAAWAKEKSNLQQALKLTEAELAKMKAEARNEALQTELLGSCSESIAVKRIYGKYLRAESFRKALIYQKKYLLLLLGGFQECEQATLSFIARMGGHPCYTSLQVITRRSRSFTRFRSVVRVVVAISRLRFLVRRWQRSSGSSSLNRNGHGQSLANELRMDSPFVHSGTISLESSLARELFGDRRHCTSRQRSGQESPRSATNSQHRSQSSLPDSNSGSLAASHLQSYDPDRALTDYINRLESLQRRLGSVQSGSASYAQMHYGTRR